jgi:hypothetical protein
MGAWVTKLKTRIERAAERLERQTSGSRLTRRDFRFLTLPLNLERVMGIEPTPSAWKAEVLPLNYTRMFSLSRLAPFFAANHPENPLPSVR